MNKKSIIDEMKAYYDQRAPWHDEYMNYQGINKMEELFLPIIKILDPIIKNQSVLEIACGTGNWTQLLAKRAKNLTAIDSSKQSLEIAKKKLVIFENVSLECLDIYAYDNLQIECNVIFAVDFISHIPKKQIDSFLTMLQNLVPSGTPVIFLEMSMKKAFQNEEVYVDTDSNRVSKRKLPDGSSYDIIKNFYTEIELHEIFAEFGNSLSYTKFDSLQRWMIVYHTK